MTERSAVVRPAASQAPAGTGASAGSGSAVASLARAPARVPSCSGGRIAAQTQGSTPSRVARWRWMRLTSGTPLASRNAA